VTDGTTDGGRGGDDDAFVLLRTAARLMLEYNVRSAVLAAQVRRLGKAVGRKVEPILSYRQATLCFEDGRCVHVQAPEYRLNVAVSSGVMRLVDQVVAGVTSSGDALVAMQALEKSGGVRGRWPLAVMFGLAASALACILHADFGTILVTGVSSALGLLARKELGQRHWPLLSLPFVAGVIGGLAGGVAIRFDWTHTAGLCLMVPALMLVPGPHLINGVADVFENHVVPGVGRLVLAAAIFLASALGVFAGGWLVMGLRNVDATTSDVVKLTLMLDVILAGIASCGFGAFYNSPWRALGMSIGCGMVGHGVRFLCLGGSAGLPASTFMACGAIGILAGVAAHQLRLPFPNVAFAGAVPMMPGALIYRSIAGAAKLSMAGTGANPADATATLVTLLQALLVVGAMAGGLFAGALLASPLRHLVRERRLPTPGTKA
jgi:uncharacterized membrane protein YjjP (DUF1212 family)